jgi:hypothetical protein
MVEDIKEGVLRRAVVLSSPLKNVHSPQSAGTAVRFGIYY